MESIWNLIIYFAICAFIGWIIQSLEELISKRKITNAGFLYGPFVPVFGFTALAIYFFNLYFINFPLSFRLAAYFIIPTIIEYFTGYLLETIFKVKLWDYSYQRFNIKGRISLVMSTIWFVFISFHVFILQKIIFDGMNQFSEIFKIIVAVSLIIYFGTDLFFSAKVFYYFSKIKTELEKTRERIDLKKLNKKFISKMKSVSKRVRMSYVLKRNLSKELGEFMEQFGKR